MEEQVFIIINSGTKHDLLGLQLNNYPSYINHLPQSLYIDIIK